MPGTSSPPRSANFEESGTFESIGAVGISSDGLLEGVFAEPPFDSSGAFTEPSQLTKQNTRISASKKQKLFSFIPPYENVWYNLTPPLKCQLKLFPRIEQ